MAVRHFCGAHMGVLGLSQINNTFGCSSNPRLLIVENGIPQYSIQQTVHTHTPEERRHRGPPGTPSTYDGLQRFPPHRRLLLMLSRAGLRWVFLLGFRLLSGQFALL